MCFFCVVFCGIWMMSDGLCYAVAAAVDVDVAVVQRPLVDFFSALLLSSSFRAFSCLLAARLSFLPPTQFNFLQCFPEHFVTTNERLLFPIFRQFFRAEWCLCCWCDWSLALFSRTCYMSLHPPPFQPTVFPHLTTTPMTPPSNTYPILF